MLTYNYWVGQRVEDAKARFDRPRGKDRKAELEAILEIYLEGQTELTRLGVDDSSLHQRILWGLIVTEKELSWCSRFDLATRLEHVKKAEQYCDRLFGMISQHPNFTNAVRLALESNIIKGMGARLKVRDGADKN